MMDGAPVCEKAYAKVNFGLKVYPCANLKQENQEVKYHPIEGIFQTIELYDDLIVTGSFDSKNECNLVCKWCSDFDAHAAEFEFVDRDNQIIKLPEKNTITSAYHGFCEVVCEDFNLTKKQIPSVSVELKKKIPAGGGLGGGSADGAALIRALEKICGISLSFEQLDRIASKVGSDVFFFVHCDSEGKGCAFVWGRGEKIKKIKPRNDLFLLLIFPNVSSSTKEAYSLLDEWFLKQNGKREVNSLDNSVSEAVDAIDAINAIYDSSIQTWTLKNTFTPVIASCKKEVGEAIQDLKNAGCCYAEMTGSGSTVYGVFTLKQQADAVCYLLGKKWNCKLVRVI